MVHYDDQICRCFGLFKDELIHLIVNENYTNTYDLSENFGYGLKCGQCLNKIEKIINKNL